MSMRIPAPNYTLIPNDLVDHWLPLVNGPELRVLLVIIRKTFGHQITPDEMSMKDLVEMTGMREETIIKATESLERKGAISREVYGYLYLEVAP